jgi:2Fe-2S ferredoxin
VKFRFFEEANDLRVEVDAPIGKKVLDVALENNIDIEGACGGELACSTCHVVVPKEVYDKLPPKKIEEEDMLDLAWGVTDTSRLCCQIQVTELLQGVEFKVPKETNNML